MTRTARRRWSRDFQGEIDGVFLGERGPLFLHGYDPPAGGKWIDDVIPGKLGALDRSSGEVLWVSPCEVGYGRGFGAGLGNEDDIVVLGPSTAGHRIVRMSTASGELLAAGEIGPFDRALVSGDMCVTVMPQRVCGVMTTPMLEVWNLSDGKERYHLAARAGEDVLVVYTESRAKRQGVLRVDLESGDRKPPFLSPEYSVIHDVAAGGGVCVVLSGSKSRGREEILIEAFSLGTSDPTPLWRERVADEVADELPEVTVTLDSGKLYVARGAIMQVRDALSGRELGEVTLPGLDEHIAWQVSQGAAVLAEETRASMFEVPA